jgi:glutathione S-transferase
MKSMSITLYFAPGTRATRIAFLLEELGVPWEKVTLDLAQREHKAADYLALNPNGVVPTLKDGDTVIFESVAIALHLADRFAEKGLAPPADSPLRGRYLSWMVWSMTTLEPPIGDVYLERTKPADQQSGRTVDAALERFRASAQVLEGALAGPYLLGDTFSAADVMVGCVLSFADMLGMLESHPRLRQYVASITERPAYLRAMQ